MAKGIYRRENTPYWWYKFEYGGRRFRGSTQTTSEREARRILAEARDAAAQEMKRAARSEGPFLTFGQACEAYFDEVGQHHAGASKTSWSLNWLQAEIGAHTRLDAIDGAMVMRVVSKRRGEAARLGGKLAHSTVNRSATEPLRKVLLHARKVHGAELHKAIGGKQFWKQYLLREPAARVRELKAEEEQALFDACRDDYAPIIRYALLTGCRLSECVRLTWADVDFGSRLIVIRGKGGSVLPIPMPPAVRELLWDLRGKHKTAVFTYTAQRTRDGRKASQQQPITINGLSTAWRRIKEKAGLEDYRFHDNRHTTATRVLRAGGNLGVVKQLLRHARIETTMRYAHVHHDDIAAAMQAAADAASTAAKPARKRGKVVALVPKESA